MFMLNSNEPTKVAHLQKLANQSMLNSAFAIEMIINSFSESKRKLWWLHKARNALLQKSRDMGSEKYNSTRFH